MVSENNPNLYIDYNEGAFHPTTGWVDLLPYTIDFNTKAAGILRLSEATLTLKNTDGRFTDGGSESLKLYKLLRIRADVRDEIDQLFYGRITEPDAENKKKQEYITVKARGFFQKLVQDTITKKYLEEENMGVADRSMNDVINHFLANPDSGVNTNIILATTGDITTIKAKHNFDREWLLDAIKRICQFVGYDGYEFVNAPYSTLHLVLLPYGTNPAAPAITIPQTAIDRNWLRSIEDIKNYIFMWISAQLYYPHDDYTTESGVAKGYWTALGGCSVADIPDLNKANFNSVLVTKPEGVAVMEALDTFPLAIDLEARLITALEFYLYSTAGIEDTLQVILHDSVGETIMWESGVPHAYRSEGDGWTFYSLPLSSESKIHTGLVWDRWRYAGGSSTFNFILAKMEVSSSIGTAYSAQWKIDALHFLSGMTNNPIENEMLRVKDDDSIAEYDPRV